MKPVLCFLRDNFAKRLKYNLMSLGKVVESVINDQR